MTKDEAIQRYKAAYQDEYGNPTTWDDEAIARINAIAIRALMDADKPLSVPVDPDLLLARKIVTDEYERDGFPSMAAAIRDGEWDTSAAVRAALAGIRAGKAMR